MVSIPLLLGGLIFAAFYLRLSLINNHSAKAIEVVNENLVPIFQIFYKDDTHLVINGAITFTNSGVNGVVLSGGEGFKIMRNPPLGSGELLRKIEALNIKRIFRYPAWEFPGQFGESAQEPPTIEDEITHNARIAMARQWQPPELPSGIEGISIIIGSSARFDYDMSRLTTDTSGVPNGHPLVVFPGGSPAVSPYVKNNRLYVMIDTPFGTSRETVHMNNEWDSKIPSGWDRNFNSDRFEIVDDTKLPVLQVWYVTPFQIEINGIFVSENGGVAVAFGKGIAASSPGAPIPKIPDRKAWFKYPSKDHLEELAN
ncbi:MAG: hypothetical protein ABSD57_07035 [Verrucomicrobiota bacterium]